MDKHKLMARSPSQHQDEEPPSSRDLHSIPSASKDNTTNGSFLKRLLRLFKWRQNHSLEEEVAELIEEHDPEGTQIGSEERNMLTNVLNLKDKKVSDIMIPRTDIVAIEDTTSLAGLKKTFAEKEHTRIPVFHKTLDNVVGFIHMKDLIPFLGSKQSFHLRHVMREILFVAPSMKILDLLVRMRHRRVHMAVVLDEYGGTEGLITLENLMEEIVGDIEDEHDTLEQPDIKKLQHNQFDIDAKTDIDTVEKTLGETLTTEDNNEEFDTIGGLIFFMLGRVPEIGEKIAHPSGLEFTIKEADQRRIKRIIVKKN